MQFKKEDLIAFCASVSDPAFAPAHGFEASQTSGAKPKPSV